MSTLLQTEKVAEIRNQLTFEDPSVNDPPEVRWPGYVETFLCEVCGPLKLHREPDQHTSPGYHHFTFLPPQDYTALPA